jgi:hypothetical protein
MCQHGRIRKEPSQIEHSLLGVCDALMTALDAAAGKDPDLYAKIRAMLFATFDLVDDRAHCAAIEPKQYP